VASDAAAVSRHAARSAPADLPRSASAGSSVLRFTGGMGGETSRHQQRVRLRPPSRGRDNQWL